MPNASQARVMTILKNYIIGPINWLRIPILVLAPRHFDASSICNWLPLPNFEISLGDSPWAWLD